jgi:hypothetical protein
MVLQMTLLTNVEEVDNAGAGVEDKMGFVVQKPRSFVVDLTIYEENWHTGAQVSTLSLELAEFDFTELWACHLESTF